MKLGVLTPKQYRVLDVIRVHFAMTKQSPTVEEMRCALGLNSARTVSQYLDTLEQKGYILRRKNMHRNIELRGSDGVGMPRATTISVPVVANVGCDDLSVFAQEQYDEYIEVDKDIAEDGDGGVVAVRAVGDSMNDAGIQSGDYVLIRFSNSAENGDKVAAIIDDMVTVKLLERTAEATILRPVSRDLKYKPIILRRDFKIVGKVLCVVSNHIAEQTEVVPIEEEREW